jgi:gamma-glutamylcyclotransferase (GGCT)/AIG2-like uncharacterized protein YtfP
MNKVAVYGSLLKGLHNHRLLEESTLLGETQLGLNCKLLDLGSFPGLVKAEQPAVVNMEVYEVTEATMQRLDMLEGHPTFYEREEVDTEYGTAWLYFLHNEDGYYGAAPVVESGDWRGHHVS